LRRGWPLLDEAYQRPQRASEGEAAASVTS